jgi:hypothetical protein
LPRDRSKRQLSEEERLILRCYTDLRLLKVSELIKADDNAGVYTELENALSLITERLWRLYEVLAQAYFSHSQMPQLMIQTQPEDEL